MLKTIVATALFTIALVAAVSASGGGLYPDQDSELHLSGGTMTGPIVMPYSNDPTNPDYGFREDGDGLYAVGQNSMGLAINQALRYSITQARFAAAPDQADALLAVGALEHPEGLDRADSAAYSMVVSAIFNLYETITRN